ncbi:hypothetical protein ACIBCM_13680 [Streptomyces sp. NPDC051018]|uniref:hypothetical protein n=1 Tax=Streptomyces sp. NPDC051018 TaxID=3365639 RepID=UPI0037A3F443
MNKFARIGITSIALLGAVQVASPVTAAPAAPTEQFHVCYKNSDCNMGYSAGVLDWNDGGHAQHLSGSVVNRTNSDYSTTVVFEAYSFDEKVDSDSRTSRNGTHNFDVFLTGWMVNRIKITVCQNFPTGQKCGAAEHYYYG